ncbi:MAG: metalloregulator ArsR/SmtB family transcription factor [Actinomycetota bacterium]|nr:metalloregulator ArsR/SmtB family transcription factor [Actinomycetota bacterium]
MRARRSPGIPDDLQPRARALGDPTRFRIFCYLVEAERPVGVAELTDHVGLNHNAVRQHLAVLRSAGLVDESTEARARPGRPRLVYRVGREAAGGFGVPGPYERLSALLAEVVRTGDSPEAVGLRAGRSRAAQLGGVGHGSPFRAIEEELSYAGFRPEWRGHGDPRELVLHRCPFESAAVASPSTVCGVHLGLARGLAEGIGGLEVVDLVAKDPRRAGCRLFVKPTGGPATAT